MSNFCGTKLYDTELNTLCPSQYDFVTMLPSWWFGKMMVKKVVIGVLLAALMQVANATQRMGPYAGALIGTSDMGYSSSNQGLFGASKDRKSRAWYAFAGYKFNQNFAIQTGYMQFGDVSFEGIRGVPHAKSDYTQKALEITGKLIYPLSSVATFYAKGGAAFVNLDRSPNNVAAVMDIPHNDKTKIKPFYGLGVTYEFYPNLSGEVAWQQISGGNDIETSNFVGFGVQFAVG